jgi:nucleotide-binding universal stress UspA family protein
MVQHLIVPVDGSDASWRAADVAVALARRSSASIDVVEVVFDQHHADEATVQLAERLEQHDTSGVAVTARVLVAAESVAQVVGTEVEHHPATTVVLASHGRGRSAALLGSVTEELLGRIFGPVLVVGPHVTQSQLDGPIVVTVDGSAVSESALPLAAAWAIELGNEAWIVEVVAAETNLSGDVAESAYPARLAHELADKSGHPVQFEVLHGKHVHDQVADFASSIGASMIVASTRGRTGMSRFVVGSTAAAIVRHAPCPVLLVRPPHLQT